MKAFNSVLSAVVVSVLGLSATLNAPQALAVDGKNYSGYTCNKWAGDGLAGEYYGSVVNASLTAWLYLACPVDKDVIDSNVSYSWVSATDRNPNANANISCYLASVYRNTSNSSVVFTNSGIKNTEGSSNRVQYLNSGALVGNPYGHYYYSCAIPPRYNDGTANGGYSEIHTYQVTEEGNG